MRFYNDRIDGGYCGDSIVCVYGANSPFRFTQEEHVQGAGAGICFYDANGRQRRGPERQKI